MRKPLLSLMVALCAALVLSTPASAVSIDPFRDRQWGLAKVRAVRAWNVTRGRGAVIAIVDTGVDFGHPDLAANLLAAPGGDFVQSGDTCSGKGEAGDCTGDGPQDQNGHGTHVAGIAAAIAGNGRGIAGVAPRARILAVRVLDADGSGTVGDVASGIRYAANRGVDVINLSLEFDGGLLGDLLGGDLDEIKDAIDYAVSKGSVVVAAAGNSSTPICNEISDNPKVLCVGATDAQDQLAPFSNYDGDGDHTYLVAPGGDGESCESDVLSTVLRTLESDCGPRRGYDSFAGTSMAAPHVAGIAALLASLGLDDDEIVACLTRTADDLGAEGRDEVFGYGRVNALRAVRTC